MKIGITDPMGNEDRYHLYARWISTYAPEAEIVRLSYRLDNLADAEGCDAILLTGGGDVDPVLYGGTAGNPKLVGVDPDRDRFERGVMDLVLRKPRPFLGICRGMQFVNVYMGGTLFPDVEDAGYRSHCSGTETQSFHAITVSGAGVLSGAVGAGERLVNTFHHQAVDKVAPALRAVAASDDGLVEALELPGAEWFFLLVQWHPERMQDQSNPCAGRIAELFLEDLLRYLEATTHTRR